MVRSGPPSSGWIATPARSSAERIGRMCWIARRCWGVSMKPPVPGVDASRKVSGDTHSALPVVSTRWSRLTPRSRSRIGSARTCSCRSRWPKIATLATPGTAISRGWIVQRARTDISIGVRSVELSPTIMNRFSDERGWSITGALATLGRACDCVSRSATTCRALKMSVPGSKIITIDERPASDCERISSRNATPWSRSASSGTVTSSSTSSADRPSASVCTST